ncbi:hypothetical protein L198_06387 [Cryptococcus wingfieldii CBS 7118]|uniref:Thioesterase n=1 Tax=Cryptococcus wingfieldii CBS 7118 TaxID=1295528 RepID=A0A1E3IP41_9TREE|nr:hypothetical protein L198_06387 [Cryptococcus wingfieldii CBS 7118]ODN89696.1 hypothetical protein L198_06387 [Cryptococcus wingfieldii CBS 7118]
MPPKLAVTDQDIVNLQELYAKFQDPTSHYHIPPGTNGPEHEEDHASSRTPDLPTLLAKAASIVQSTSSTAEIQAVHGDREIANDRPWQNAEGGAQQKALDYFRQEGHDTVGVLTWPVAWGDQDSFQHVNNVQFLRWIESARIRYGESWGPVLGEKAVYDLLHAKGTGFILKDVSIKYRAPITYPDTVMISNRIHSVNPERASYGHQHIIWSMKDGQVKALADSTVVMYDYDNLKKGVMSDQFRELLQSVEYKKE